MAVEDPLLFTQYAFHRQKLLLHRVSMRRYLERLGANGHRVELVGVDQAPTHDALASWLQSRGIRAVRYVDPCDDWLGTQLRAALASAGIAATVLDDPHFLTPRTWIDTWVRGRKRLFFTDFYVAQRQRLQLLLTADRKPLGRQWSFDPDNRKRLPRTVSVPPTPWRAGAAPEDDVPPGAPGDERPLLFPADHAEAAAWLEVFVRERLAGFGDYEDAISRDHTVLFHSVLTPMLNIGLLSPQQVVAAALAHRDAVPLNALEGFVRQVIGWREFVRVVYLTRGRRQRSTNFWGHTRPMPAAFYSGTTGLDPVDHVIRQVLSTGYCHHIERLMILGNIMLLCEIHPTAVYQWFMELFVDAYDWVMVPNVYGMSQFADGGGMTTKPYLSGSNYILRMSDFPRGDWCATWDALYWRFIDRHAAVFASNPRMAVMVQMARKLGPRLAEHHERAEQFLAVLHGAR